MSVIDNALQALFKMVHWETVWENASPNSAFPPQKINMTINQDESVKIICRQFVADGKTSNSYGQTEKYTETQIGEYFQIGFNKGENANGYRVIVLYREGVAESNGIQFFDAVYTREGAVNLSSNDSVIPVKILKKNVGE